MNMAEIPGPIPPPPISTARVRDVWSFISTLASTYSLQAYMKLMTITTTMPLRTWGSMIPSRMRSDDAPSMRAESGSSWDTI